MFWTWPGEEEGSMQPTVSIADGKIVWDVEVDHDYRRPGNHEEQTFEDFIGYGPAWYPPANITAALIEHLGLKDPVWQRPGFDPYPPAWHAIEAGDEAKALALAAGEDPRRSYRHSRTLLMQAAGAGMRKLVKQLLKAGADPNAKDDRAQTALLLAVFGRTSLPVVEALADAGGGPLDEAAAFAIGFGRRDVAEWLLRRGAKIANPELILDVSKLGWVETLRLMIERGADPNQRNSAGSSPLMWALSPETVEFLIAAGSDPKLLAKDGESALSMACVRGKAAVAALLLRAGADPDARTFRSDFGGQRGQTVLFSSIECGKRQDLVELLLASGADPNAAQPSKWTALHCAALREDVAAARLLIQAGAKVNARIGDHFRKTPLAFAKTAEMREFLIANGAVE